MAATTTTLPASDEALDRLLDVLELRVEVLERALATDGEARGSPMPVFEDLNEKLRKLQADVARLTASGAAPAAKETLATLTATQTALEKSQYRNRILLRYVGELEEQLGKKSS